MISKDYITEWREHAPWVSDAHVEQDLVISRALVEIFNVPDLARRLAFRGGTALHKLHLAPAARYSEDIDLVQVEPEPIGATLDSVRSVLDPWLGQPRRELKEGRVNLVYRFASEEQPPMPLRLKIEINSREHFSELGHSTMAFDVTSRWWNGAATVTTFALEELLGTKLRALYQRKKGRDLFDLWHAIHNGRAAPGQVLSCFHRYMRESGLRIRRADFERNLAEKLDDSNFLADIGRLLRPGFDWEIRDAAALVAEKILAQLSE